MEEYVSIAQAARMKGKYNAWMQYYIREGRAPKMDIIAGRKVFLKKDVQKWNPTPLRRGPKKKKK